MDKPNQHVPMVSQRHWVEELFPPHFTVDVEDLTKKPEEAEEGSLEAWRLAQRRKLKDIYQEVKERLDAEAQKPKDKNIQVGEPLESASKNRVKLKGQAKRVQGLGSSPEDGILVKDGNHKEKEKTGNGDAIWSAGEMAIIREEFKRLKGERRVILIEMRALEEEVSELRSRHKHQGEVLGRREGELRQAHQECQRLQLQREDLTKEVRLQKSKLAMAEADHRDVAEQRLAMRKEIIEQRKALARVKRDARELQIALSERDTKHRLESMEKEEALKLEYESQIARLYEELTETRTDLEKERSEHARSKKALDHLRIHFAQQVGKAELPSDTQSSAGRPLNVLQLF